MKRALALVTATAVLGGGAALAAAAPTTIRLTSVQVSTKQSATGFSSTDNVFIKGRKVGTDKLSCVFKGQAGGSCKVTLNLPKGVINVAFASAANQTGGPLKIVGGTGGYAGATGAGTYRNLNKDGSRTAVVLNLK